MNDQDRHELGETAVAFSWLEDQVKYVKQERDLYKRLAERNHKANMMPCPRCGYRQAIIESKEGPPQLRARPNGESVYYPCSNTPLCIQLKSETIPGQWSADSWWREEEISKAWERFHWHAKNNYPLGGKDVRLVRYSFEVLG